MKARPLGASVPLRPGASGGEKLMSANSATHRLWREIAVVLALKTAALALLYFLCFPASQRPQISPAAVAEKLFARDRG